MLATNKQLQNGSLKPYQYSIVHYTKVVTFCTLPYNGLMNMEHYLYQLKYQSPNPASHSIMLNPTLGSKNNYFWCLLVILPSVHLLINS